MRHEYHTLLPIHMQASLMDAALPQRIVYMKASLIDDALKKSVEAIDAVVSDLHFSAPFLFHNEQSEKLRRFHHEPRQNVLNAGFVVPYKGLRY